MGLVQRDPDLDKKIEDFRQRRPRKLIMVFIVVFSDIIVFIWFLHSSLIRTNPSLYAVLFISSLTGPYPIIFLLLGKEWRCPDCDRFFPSSLKEYHEKICEVKISKEILQKRNSEIIEEFERRKRFNVIGNAVIFLYAVGFGVLYLVLHFLIKTQDMTFMRFYIFLMPIAVGCGVFLQFWSWRCPACGKMQGRRPNPNFCRHCNIALR